MENIREELLSLAEADYAAFALRLLPSGTKLMGVRLPKLRKIARRLAATKQGRAFAAQNHKGEFFEEKMLRGMLIGALKVSTAERISSSAVRTEQSSKCTKPIIRTKNSINPPNGAMPLPSGAVKTS